MVELGRIVVWRNLVAVVVYVFGTEGIRFGKEGVLKLVLGIHLVILYLILN
jgi:hypothetical protein